MSSDAEQLPGPIVIVGGGAVAAAAAASLARAERGDEVVVLTAEDRPPYDRTMLSKAVLSGDEDGPSELYAEQLADVDVRTGSRVTAIDREARTVAVAGARPVAYGTLLLATGAVPRTLPLPGIDLTGVHTLRSAADADDLVAAASRATEVVVIGGGLIGLEAAASLRARNVGVTVVEVADRLLGRVLPAGLAGVVAAAHRAAGTRLEIGARPTGLVGDDDGAVRAVELDDGRALDADVVLVAIGVDPATRLAEDAGLDVDDGVLVDRALVSSDPAVLAAGDAVRVADDTGGHRPRTQAWTPALTMGQYAARTILGEDVAYDDVPMMWSDQLDLQVQAAGVSVADLDRVERGDVDGGGRLVLGLDDEGRVVGAAGVSRGRGIARLVRGAQALIAAGVVADRADLTDPDVDLRRLARP